MSKPTGDIAREYLEKYPQLSIRAIANKIWEDENLQPVFNSYEHVRTILRTYTGSAGKYNREVMTNKKYYRTNLPTPIHNKLEHYTIPKANTNILCLSDIHAPHQDNEALSAAISYGVEKECDTIILNGDTIDFYAISRWETDYRKRNLPNELYTCRDILYTIREAFPKALFIYKYGNHDIRWDALLLKHCLKGIEEIELPRMLHFNELDIIKVDDKATIWAGRLAVLHGHEHKYGMIAPVNPARGLFLRTKQSAIMGHVHRVSEHTEKAHDGKLLGCWSTGCLCELTPDFMPYNNHGHGFAHIKLSADGMFTVYNKKIINGEVY